MKKILAICLAIAALLPACSSTRTTTANSARATDHPGRYAAEAPVGGAPTADIPAQGPADTNSNPAFFPSPLLRANAAGGP